MRTVRQEVLNLLKNGTLNENSLLIQVPHIGSYIEGRFRFSFSAQNPITLRKFWDRTRRFTTTGVKNLILRSLQNERSNQCVSTRVIGQRRRKSYHTPDVNERGYEAIVALLEYNRSNARYGTIPPRLPRRSDGSKTCGCRSVRNCRGLCRLSDDARQCVPASSNANGFIGVVAHQSQRENATNVSNVRRALRTKLTNRLRRDPDSMKDVRRRHSQTLAYDRRGSRLWRRPSTRVRSPR